MKEEELRKHAVCDLCGKKIGESGVPLFWTVKIKRWGLNAAAIKRQMGLTMFLGNAAIAQAMSPDEDMAEELYDGEITVCERCATSNRLPLAAMMPKDED